MTIGTRRARTDRRTFLGRAGAAMVATLAGRPPRAWADEPGGLIAGIERSVLFRGRDKPDVGAWFHPRACMVPTPDGPLALMTMQRTTGSDYFHPVVVTTSADLGKTWSPPVPIPGFGRKPGPNGAEVGVCDVVPEFHLPTNATLVMGHNVYYKDGRLMMPQPPRWPVYTVRDAQGNWSAPARLVWNDPRGSQIYTCGCSQRVTLADGDILLALSFAPRGRADRMIASVRCAMDGRKLAIRRVGNALELRHARGLLEPSLVEFQGQFLMTIRAEDKRGYVAVSDDGLTWSPHEPWTWEDGTPLVMSTTQQHWLTHSDGLFLVYTRRTKENINVFRWRAPLFVARVDPRRRCLLRDTERVVFPLVDDGVNDGKNVARMGNFHTNFATPTQSWITVGECLPNDGWAGDTLLARVTWRCPNRPVTSAGAEELAGETG